MYQSPILRSYIKCPCHWSSRSPVPQILPILAKATQRPLFTREKEICLLVCLLIIRLKHMVNIYLGVITKVLITKFCYAIRIVYASVYRLFLLKLWYILLFFNFIFIFFISWRLDISHLIVYFPLYVVKI